MKWLAVLRGPINTPWSRRIFRLIINFNEDYPNRPPVVVFCDKDIFHPNIYSGGKVCLDILSKRWSPIYNVNSILFSIQNLLQDPNPGSPANIHAAILFQTNQKEYYRVIEKINFFL